MNEIVSNRLPVLAEEINAEHQSAALAFGKGLEHAIKAGKVLCEAKKLVPHPA